MRAGCLALGAALLLLPAAPGRARQEEPAGAAEAAGEEESGEAAGAAADQEPEQERGASGDETGAEALALDRDGWYAAVQGVYAVEDWKNPGGSAVHNDWGMNGRLGYRFLRYCGLEFEYERVLQFRVDAGPARPDLRADANVYTLNAKGFLPLGRLHPFAIAGFGLHQTDVDDAGTPLGTMGGGERGTFAARLGAGLELYLTEHLVWLTEATYVLPWFSDNNDMKYASIGFGVQWRFAPTRY
jgi:hypothetical protein